MYTFIISIILVLILSGCDQSLYHQRQDVGNHAKSTSSSQHPVDGGKIDQKNNNSSQIKEREITNFDLPTGWHRSISNPTELHTIKNGQAVNIYWVPNTIEDYASDPLVDIFAKRDLTQARQKCEYFDCAFAPYLKVTQNHGIKFFAIVEPAEMRESGISSTVYFKNNLGFYSSLVITANFENYIDDLTTIANSMRKENWTNQNTQNVEKAQQQSSQLPPF